MKRAHFFAAVLWAGIAGFGVAQEERRTLPAHEFTLTLHTTEDVGAHTLWVSRDSGATWAKAAAAGVSETWGDWADGRIRITVRVPEDGPYDFHAQMGDRLTNLGAEPQAGRPAEPKMRFQVSLPTRALILLAPFPGQEHLGGNQILIKWKGNAAALREKSVQISAQVDSESWVTVASGLDAEGQYVWVLPTPAQPALLRFRLSATTPDGKEATAPQVEGSLYPGRAVAALAWDYPKNPATWTGGATVNLKWFSLGTSIRNKSAELQYSLDGAIWTTITKGLDPTGSYFWMVPNQETSTLHLRVRALTDGGQEQTAISVPVTVRPSGRPDLSVARALYDRARVLQAQQRTAEATLKYEEALASWSSFGEALNDLGKLYADQEETTKALEYFLRARQASPSDPTVYVNAAIMEVRLGLFGDAVKDLRDANALGLEKDEHIAVLAGETLWRIAAAASITEDWVRVEQACEILVRIRKASPITRDKAVQQLDWIVRQKK